MPLSITSLHETMQRSDMMFWIQTGEEVNPDAQHGRISLSCIPYVKYYTASRIRLLPGFDLDLAGF